MKDRSQKHPDAWRLPAEQLESLIADLIGRTLSDNSCAGQLVQNPSAVEIANIQSSLQDLQSRAKLLSLVERVDLKPGKVSVQVNQSQIADQLGVDAQHIDPNGLPIEAPFQMRRWGVELRLHLGNVPPEIDRTLVQNVVKAQRWMSMILDGKSFAEIASQENTSKRRVQDVVDLAMLAPDILKSISRGEQPDELTSDHLIKTGVTAIWTEQRSEYAKL